MKAIKISENVTWVGATDWKLRNFHGYTTHRGSTYNAYLVLDKKVTLIDTVKAPFSDELLERISSVIDPSKIDYIISNHAEPDHSGAIPAVLKVAKNANVIASPNGERALNEIFGSFPVTAVKSGETLCTGKYTFTFTHTPMVHWPDNMVTYMTPGEILFSNDAFGQHYAASDIMDFENDPATILYEAKKYYANIVMPYSPQAKKALDAVKALPLKMIAGSHGIVWQKHIPDILSLYERMVTGAEDNTALIVYDTMWGSTDRMARAISDALKDKGVKYYLLDLKNNDISDIMEQVLTAKYLFVGSSTLNNNILPTVAAFLCYLKGLSHKPKKFMAFGSYGWGGQGAGIINAEMLSMKMLPLCEPVKIKNVPDEAALKALTEAVKGLIE